MQNRKKLIEVALPLEAINEASAREKSIRHGHPSTLHLWWARRPLAAARAVIFAQMVDDPSGLPDLFPTEQKQEKERQLSIGVGSGPQIGIQKGPPRFAFRTISARAVGAGRDCGDGASAW